MNLEVKKQVFAEVVEKLSKYNEIGNPPRIFSIGKDIIPSCPPVEDIREVIDQLSESQILNLGFGYIQGASDENRLTFIRLDDDERIRWVAQRITVRLRSYTANQLQGLDEFESDLSKMYNVQHTERWIPAFATGTELGLIFTIGSCILPFIKNVVIPGLEWDLIKDVFSALWKGLDKLSKKNDEFDIQTLELQFNDVTIKVNDVMAGNYGSLTKLFVSMYEQLQNLRKQGIEDICQIEVPFVKDDVSEEGFRQDFAEDDFNGYWWKVTYLKGCSQCWFNPESGEIA